MDAPSDARKCVRTELPSPVGGRSDRSGGARNLMRRLLKRVADDSGQSLILVVLFMFVIVAVAAFAVDAGEMSVARHKAQIAADSSALSAAQDMESATTPAATVTTDATTISGQNDPGSTDSITQPNGANGNTASSKVTSPVSLTFGNFFGLANSQVQATATAQVTSEATQIPDGNVSNVGCPAAQSTGSNCSYYYSNPCTSQNPGGCVIPNSGTEAGNWEVTTWPENDTSGPTSGQVYKNCGGNAGVVGAGVFVCGTPNDWTGNPASNENQSSAVSQVNIQDCGGGTSGAGACYPPCPTSGPCNGSNGAIPNETVLDLNGEGEGGVWESVATIPNAKYTLSFWLTGNPALGNYTTFYMDTQITNGDNAQYTPFVASPNAEAYSNCPATAVTTSCLISSNYYTILDPTYNGAVAAQFYQETISFTARSVWTTLTFNSEQSDNDAYDASYGGGYFNCGPEITNISMNYPQIILTQ